MRLTVEVEYGPVSHATARRVFREHNEPPYLCDFCGEVVQQLGHRGVVHHRNHDHDDDRPENLGAAHKGCHNVHHGIGQHHASEVLERIRQRHLGSKRSPETRRRIADAQRGQRRGPRTPEQRARIAAGQRRRWQTRDQSELQRDERGRFQ